MDPLAVDPSRIVGASTRFDPAAAATINDFGGPLVDWIAKVRHGDFAAIPEVMSFQDACEFASLIDGFELAGGILESFAIGNRVVGDILRFGRTREQKPGNYFGLKGFRHPS